MQPRLKRWCDFIHSHGLRVFYHTDGAARRLLGEIIDCGIDVLNPIQHTCPGMDIEELKREFGHRVIFHGGIDINLCCLAARARMCTRKSSPICRS